MATVAGAHAGRVNRARDLLSAKGRKEHGLFAFEGPTLLQEASKSSIAIEELFVREDLYDDTPAVRVLEAAGTPVFLVDGRTAAKISDLETPSGILAVARQRFARLETMLQRRTLVLADLNDPGNVGTLLRSAEAFGTNGVVLGSLGVDPYHPKVVRASMGAIFRLELAVEPADEFGLAARRAAVEVFGLDARGEDLRAVGYPSACAIVVGHERRGLGAWEDLCSRLISIPMKGPAESLNAAIAGSIALYEACQESRLGAKSQDFTQ